MGKWFFGERLLSTPGTDSLIQIHERNRLPSIRGKRNQNEAADGPSLGTRPAVNQTTKFLVSASTRPARLSTSWKVLSEILSPSLSRFFDAQGCNYASGAPSRVDHGPPTLPQISLAPPFSFFFRPRFSTTVSSRPK